MQKIISSEVWYCAFKPIDIAGSIELKNFSNDIAGGILLDIGEHKQRQKDPSSQRSVLTHRLCWSLYCTIIVFKLRIWCCRGSGILCCSNDHLCLHYIRCRTSNESLIFADDELWHRDRWRRTGYVLVGPLCAVGYNDFNNLVMQTLWWLHN